MSEFVDDYIQKNKEQFAKYKSYIDSNNWIEMDIDAIIKDEHFNDLYSEDKAKVKKAEVTKLMLELIKRQKETIKAKTDEYKLQYDLVQFILTRLKTFTSKAVSEKTTKKYKNFVDYCVDIINTHTSRVEDYLYSIDITKIENQEVRSEEIKLTKECHDGLTKIDEKVTAMNLNDEEVLPTIEFLNGKKAPLSMYDILISLPEYSATIKKALEEKGIDLESSPKNEMLIYMEDVPEWNEKVHFWENSKEALQVFFDEFKKIRDGIKIDGVYISGWAYYHINVFIASIPRKEWSKNQEKYISRDRKINPPLRDSDWMIFENKVIQEQTNTKFLFLACSRRVAKTTTESSMLAHGATIGKETLLCAGASAKDLGQLAKNFKTNILNVHPAFAVYNVTNDWEKKVELGIKTKENKTILLSTLNIINTDSGNNKEIFSGYTPDLLIGDEIMKEKFLEALEGAIPSMVGDDGTIRCFGVLSGTAGTEELSADGVKALSDPETYEILPMRWDILERGIDPEYITWEEDKQKPFGTFIPGQCRVDMPKVDSTLADYLGKPDSVELRKIKIKVTDWKAAKEKIENEREAVVRDKTKLHKTIIYAPVKPSEITQSGSRNRFPVAEAKAHKAYLLETGLWDRRRELYRDSEGKIQCIHSSKPLADFPHRGGVVDAPFLIFEDLPEVKPPYGMYTAGFDDYASDDSETSSVSSFYVTKNKVIGDPFSQKVVASISFRPERHSEVWEKWEMLMEAYNLDRTAFGENFNYGIKDYLDRRQLSEKYLAPSLDFSASFNIPNNNKRKTGWNPSTSKKFLFDLFVEFCNESHEIEQLDGSIKVMKGVQMIDDIGLLEEIIQFSENLNVDRITSAIGSYGFSHYLRSALFWVPKELGSYSRKNETPEKKETKKLQFFNQQPKQRSFFNRRR